MSEWKKVRLGEVADLCLGKMLDAKKNKGIPRPYLNNVAVRWGQFNLNELPEMKIEEEEVERYSIVKGDIVICEGGEPGRCAVWKSDEPIFFQKALHRARVKSCCDSNFIYYQFCHLVKVGETKSFETGSTIRHLPAQELKQIPISLPPLPTQRKIAAVLGALDDKIENNRKICANLEAQAQAIFKSWFVDFEPFGGKMPQGWKMGPLEGMAERIASGGTPRTKEESYYKGPIRWYSTKELKDCFLFDSEKHISEDAVENSAAKVFPRNTILMAIYAAPTVGRLGILDSESTFNQAAVGIVARQEIGYAYLYLQLLNAREGLNLMAVGSCQQNRNGGVVKSYQVLHPDDVILSKFNSLVDGLFDEIRALTKQSRALAATRDALLPKLMSGEIDVEKVKVA